MVIEIGMLIGVVSFLIGYASHTRNNKKDVAEEASEKAIISTKLDGISNGVRNVEVKMESTNNTIVNMNERLIRVEESTKQAHHRINTIEKECD